MNIDDLTLGQIKEISKYTSQPDRLGLSCMINKKVIVRTFSAGCWFGVLQEKSGSEIILTNARRLWRWHAKESISLSAVAKYGVRQDKSKIVAPVDSIWLEAIEIIPCTPSAIESLEAAPYVEAE